MVNLKLKIACKEWKILAKIYECRGQEYDCARQNYLKKDYVYTTSTPKSSHFISSWRAKSGMTRNGPQPHSSLDRNCHRSRLRFNRIRKSICILIIIIL